MALDLDRIRALAQEAHLGQTDKLGRDYFAAHLTPIATGLREFGPEAEAAGWLHDIVEDTQHTGDTLREAGVPEDVVAGVESVTKVEGEPYEHLIDRACDNSLGRLVKLVDNTWNIVCSSRLAETQPDVVEDLLRRKYWPAKAKLLAALGWEATGPELQRIKLLLIALERDLGAPANGSPRRF